MMSEISRPAGNGCPDRRVLILHYDPAFCEELQMLLTERGHPAVAVRSGSGALMLFNAAAEQHRRDTRLVLNSRLNDMTGRELLEKLCARDQPPGEVMYLREAGDPKLPGGFSGMIIHDLQHSGDEGQREALVSELDRLLSAPEDSDRDTGSPPRILLVDDNELGRQMVRALLENIGCRVIEAAHGQQALEIVHRQEVDLILMDLQMPVMNGLTATREIRRLESLWTSRVPILAMTADIMADQQQACREAGMNAHVAKPVELEHLYAELRRWLPEGCQDLSAVDHRIPETAALEDLLPGLEVAAGIRRCGGQRTVYLQLLQKFARSFADFGAALRRELAADEMTAARHRVHSLKGVAGNLGARELHGAAAELERQVQKQQRVTVLERLLGEHQRVLKLLDGLPGDVVPGAAPNNGPQITPNELLRRLRAPLRNLQAQQVQQLHAQLRTLSWPTAQQAELEELGALLESYQYAAAADMVEKLLAGGGPG